MSHTESQWVVEITDGSIAVTHGATQLRFSFARLKQAPYIDKEPLLCGLEDLESVPDELNDEAIEIALGIAAEEAA